MNYVIDASVAFKWVVTETESDKAQKQFPFVRHLSKVP